MQHFKIFSDFSVNFLSFIIAVLLFPPALFPLTPHQHPNETNPIFPSFIDGRVITSSIIIFPHISWSVGWSSSILTFITERSKLITELAHGPPIVNLVPLAGISIELATGFVSSSCPGVERKKSKLGFPLCRLT